MVRKVISKIIEIDRKIGIPNWLIFVLGGILILRIPSFFEPYSYGDEMIYLTLGEGVRRGLTLYKDIHDNKPPLLYLLAALAGNLFWFKVILAFSMGITTVIFWKLTEIIFEGRKLLIKVATFAFALLTTLPLLEGNIVNSELFMIGFSIAAFLVLLTKKSPKFLFLAGILFSIGALFKIPSMFDLPVIIAFWFIVSKFGKEEFLSIAKKAAILFAGFLIPILLTFVWYYFKGALSEYWVAAFLQNFGYLSSWRPDSTQSTFLVRNAPLIIRGLIVVGGVLALKKFKKNLSTTFIFSATWLLFALFAVTLSERPYPHYLIQAVAPISILTAILVASRKIEQVYAVVPLFLAVFVPVYYKFYVYNPFSYYVRFVKLATNQITKWQYFNEFDGQVERTYKIADFLTKSSNPTDQVFVWGDSAPVYALSRRLPPIKYIANYHISDFSTPNEVINALTQNPPKFTAVLPGSPNFPELQAFLTKNYIMVKTDGPPAGEAGNYEMWLRMKID